MKILNKVIQILMHFEFHLESCSLSQDILLQIFDVIQSDVALQKQVYASIIKIFFIAFEDLQLMLYLGNIFRNKNCGRIRDNSLNFFTQSFSFSSAVVFCKPL